MNSQLDINLYDRQIRTYGLAAVHKITTSSVLIYGLSKGLGTEVAKNLALGGINNIYLYDPSPVLEDDLETGFYYTHEYIGVPRAQALICKIKNLNPYINVHTTNNYKSEQNVTIIINQSMDIINEVSDYCRNINSKLIVLFSKGISGVIFVDAGNKHIINDSTGEILEPVQIGKITTEGIIYCAQNSSHNFQSGDYIKFDNLEGDNLKQFDREWKITVINQFSFRIDITDIKPFNFINGTAIEIKQSIELSHQSWTEQIINPKFGTYSLDKENDKKLVETYLNLSRNNLDNIPLPEFIKTFDFEFIPVVSLMGSIVASEAIKLVTNKYMPINQWFCWSDYTLLPTGNINYDNVKTSYGRLWGSNFENKLLNSKWFLVGAGAIGCEHLKNLAFMNIANQKLGSGEIIITDPDTIEKSNLNRQFLFHTQHIGKLKSETAANTIQIMKPNINIKTSSHKVGSDNQEFTNNIMESGITGVLNALDNIIARKFMDEMCFKYNLPLFEAGTSGTKGNTQPVIPYVTETYSNSTDPEQEKTYPLCTIKSFPNQIVHTIHWAMDQFEFFNRAPSTINKWIIDPNFINELSQLEKSLALNDLYLFTIRYPIQKQGLIGCVKWAIDMFIDNYYNSINKLLVSFPPDHETSPGIKFWSAGKRCPKPIKFDINNEVHFEYIKATTYLLAHIIKFRSEFSDEQLYKIIRSLDIVYQEVANIDNPDIGDVKEFKKVIPQIFDKDNNYCINWITAASNMRALNYGIPITDCHHTKGIAGRIIPAVATTTSAVSGLVLLEMIKYLMGLDHCKNYRSTFINLADPLVVYAEPVEAPILEINNLKFNSWTKFDYIKKNSTLKELKEYYEKQFNIIINTIIADSNILYADFLDPDILDQQLYNIIVETFEVVPNNISINFGTNDDIEYPTINICITNI